MKEFTVTVKLRVKVPSEKVTEDISAVFDETAKALRYVSAEYEIEEVTEITDEGYVRRGDIKKISKEDSDFLSFLGL